MAYGHGVHVSEVPTSVLPPVRSDAGLPVVFGTAPVNMLPEEQRAAAVNRPILCFSYAEAVAALGYAGPDSSGRFEFSLSEFMRSHFALFAVSPVVFVNVLDPEGEHVYSESHEVEIVNGRGRVPVKGILPESVKAGGTDIETTFASNGDLIVHVVDDTFVGPKLVVTFDFLDPSTVESDEVIGGIDPNTGAATGLELLNEVFPRYRMVPGQVVAPGHSADPAVAAVMRAKASSINGHFRAIALVDIPASPDGVEKYDDAPDWKNNNNIVDPLQVACWPMVELGGEVFHLSTQMAGVICATDAAREGVPYKSPSNENLQASSTVTLEVSAEDPGVLVPAEVFLGPDQAAYLNGQGIVTGLNFIGGWKAWGNRTAAYPGNTDPKDGFIAIRRMMNWIGNTLIQTFWSKVDDPLNRRQIDTVIDSANIWLNGLAARSFILGGRVEFLESENPTTDLMDGIARFHVYVTPPSPNREIDFILEYDPEYLSGLFS